MSGIALKLTTLFVRQISKPIANVIKTEAKGHPLFKKTCVRVAQTLHYMENNLRIRLLGSNARVNTANFRPLNETKAIQNGADFLSEAFIFGVAGGAIFYESYRSKKKEQNRREAVADDIKMLQDELDNLKQQLKDYKITISDFKIDSKGYRPVVLKIDGEGHVLNGDEVEASGVVLDSKKEETKLGPSATTSSPAPAPAPAPASAPSSSSTSVLESLKSSAEKVIEKVKK